MSRNMIIGQSGGPIAVINSRPRKSRYSIRQIECKRIYRPTFKINCQSGKYNKA